LFDTFKEIWQRVEDTQNIVITLDRIHDKEKYMVRVGVIFDGLLGVIIDVKKKCENIKNETNIVTLNKIKKDNIGFSNKINGFLFEYDGKLKKIGTDIQKELDMKESYRISRVANRFLI